MVYAYTPFNLNPIVTARWVYESIPNMNLANKELLNKEQLRQRLNLPSVRCVDEMVKRRKIPIIRLGYRTVRFSLSDVEVALDRLTDKAIE